MFGLQTVSTRILVVFYLYGVLILMIFDPALIGTDFSRCLFFTSALGCKRGDACAFCHHVVETKGPKARPRKDRRDALKARIWGLLRQMDVEKQEPQETWQTYALSYPLVSKSLLFKPWPM